MTQVNPSRISSYFSKFKRDKRNARRRQLRRLNPEKYLRKAKEYLNNETAWIKNLYTNIRRRTFNKDATRARKIALGHYDLHFTYEEFVNRFKDFYGDAAAGEIKHHLVK